MVQNLILIGFMAAGKTSVGRLCAQRLGWTYLDTDQVMKTSFSVLPTFSAVTAKNSSAGSNLKCWKLYCRIPIK